MEKRRKNFSLRAEPELLAKFRYVAANDGRSASGQLLLYMRRAVEKYEFLHGTIEAKEKSGTKGEE